MGYSAITHKVPNRYLIICWQVKDGALRHTEQNNTGFAPKYILVQTHVRKAVIAEDRGIGYQLESAGWLYAI